MTKIISKLLKLAVVVVAVIFSSPAFSFVKYDADYTWKTIETPHFVFHYHNGLEKMAQEMAIYGEEMQAEVSSYFNWIPREKTQVILSDQYDSPNGFATVRPYNRIEIFAVPPSSINSLEDFNNWKEVVFKHEYVHIIQIDMASEFPLHMRGLLGRWPLLFPGQFMPSWMKEGIATHIESDHSHGVGRGQSSYYRGLMRNEFLNDLKSLDTINHTPIDWPSGTASYLYGVYFFNFLEKKYGQNAIQNFFEFYQSIPVPFFLNYSASRTLGVDFDTLWTQFGQYLQEEFKQEITEINQHKIASSQLSSTGYYSGFNRVTEENHVIYIANDFEQPSRIMEYNPVTNESKVLFTLDPQVISNISRFDYHPEQGLIIPISDSVKNSRYPSDLYILKNGSDTLLRLTKDGRFIRAAWSPDGRNIAAVQINNGQHKLVLLDLSGKIISTLSAPGYDVLIGPMDWSPNEDIIVASVFRPQQGWNLELFDIPNQHWTVITENDDIESDPQFNYSGDKIIYTAEYDGIFNIYEYDLKTETTRQLTNTLTIAYQPSYSMDETKIYFSQVGTNGFNLYSRENQAIRQIYVNNNPLNINADQQFPSNMFQEHDYNALKYLGPAWWFPILTVSDRETSLGFITEFNDPLFWHNYTAQFDYDFKNNNPGWLFIYRYKRFMPNLSFASQRESFHDSDFFTQHEELYKIDLQFPFIKNRYRLNARAGYQYNHIVRQYNLFFNNFSETSESGQVVASLNLDTRSNRFRAFMPYGGVYASAMVENDDFQNEVARHSRLTLRGNYASPLMGINLINVETTIVLSGGLTEFLSVGGNFRESQLDSGFTRRTYSLKGYKSASFIGSSMHRVQVSWNLFALKPQTNLMKPPIGFSRIFFKTYAIAARVGSFSSINSEPWYRSVGTEAQMTGDFGYKHWPFTIIAGVAKGLDDKGELIPYWEIALQY